MSYQASIHDLTTGRFLLRCSVDAHDLHEAENAAVAKAAFAMNANPHEMDVRSLHQRASHRFEMAVAEGRPGFEPDSGRSRRKVLKETNSTCGR